MTDAVPWDMLRLMGSSPLTASDRGSSDLASAALHGGDRDPRRADAAGTASASRVTSRLSSTGPRLATLIARVGRSVKDCAEHAGVPRTKLSTALNGGAEVRLDWLEAMPVDVVREYVTDLANRVGLAVVPMGDADSDDARSHRVTAEAADVLRASAVNEADGYLSAAEAAEELAELRELKRALADREALLLRVIDQRGAAVVR